MPESRRRQDRTGRPGRLSAGTGPGVQAVVNNMDINDIRAWQTTILLISFIGIVIWAYSKASQVGFRRGMNLPFADEERHQATIKKENL